MCPLAGGCLATPPESTGEPGESEGDGGLLASACGNASMDIAYVSRFAVDPDGYGYVDMKRMGLVINSGEGLLDPGALEVIDTDIDDDLSVMSFGAFERDGAPIEPGEARGELSSDGRDMVLAQLSEQWTNTDAPEISGALATTHSSGTLHGAVVLGLGPHRVRLDIQFDLTHFDQPGSVALGASRTTSICADGS